MRKYPKSLIVAVLIGVMAIYASANESSGVNRTQNIDIDIWVNKSFGSTYYYGEDVAVFFRASQDCYVVVYDIDPAGNVSLLFPSDYDSDCSVRGGEVYRIPDVYDDYRLEVTGPEGKEYIYAVASLNRIAPPDFIAYEFFDYGDWDYYYDDFIHSMSGERAVFAASLNDRIVNGPYVSAHTMFFIDDNYRHHRWYRYWHPEPYYSSSVWIGCNFVGAEIWIDGCYFGIAPILVPDIYIGRHWVWIYYHGYPCWQDYIYVRYGQRYYVDAKIRRNFRDYRYGRSNMRNWRFKQEKHRNTPDFNRNAEKYRLRDTRPRIIPPLTVQEKYSKRVVRKNETSVQSRIKNNDLERNRINRQKNTTQKKKKETGIRVEKRKEDRKSLKYDRENIILKTRKEKPESKDVSSKKVKAKTPDNSSKKEQMKSKPVSKKPSSSKQVKSSRPESKTSKKRGRR